MQIWNYLMAGGCLPQQLQHWPGFWDLDWMLGPLSPALIRISLSASDPCSRTCVVTLWWNRLHLTGTVDCWRMPPCLWSTDADIATLMTHRLLHQGVFTTVYELRRGFMSLANINCCVSSRARGCDVVAWAVISYLYSGSKSWQYSAEYE